MSTRWEILQAVAAALAGLAAVTHGPTGIAGLENPVLPVLNIWWTTDARARTSKLGTTNQTLDLTVTVVDVDVAASEAWAPQVKAAIDADPTLGGLVKSTELQDERPSYLNPVFPRLGIDINYKVLYRDE